MTNGDFKDLDEVMDIESHNVHAMAESLHIPASVRWKMIQRTSRDNARTPMQWSKAPHAGFSRVRPWLKVNSNFTEVNVQSELLNSNGVLAFWKKMIALRKSNNILAEGRFRVVYEGKSIYAFQREWKGQKLLSVCNMSGKPVKLPHLGNGWDEIVISNYTDNDPHSMQPFEFRLLAKKGASK